MKQFFRQRFLPSLRAMKKCKAMFLISAVFIVIWLMYLALSPTKIIAVHISDGAARIVLENPPLTRRTKILWWKQNAEMLRQQYNIPIIHTDGYFYVSVWDFADGYKEEEDKDRLCFEDMPEPRNCIEKEWVMTVQRLVSTKRITFDIGNDSYEMLPDGRLRKRHFTWTVR
ncbi:DUF943 family protein [Siccibacter colletis]|uniref:DUF943 family protein n=1 Tax=Siccibacter colletis TaxID=1505757 RepID=UPI003CF21AD2